MGHWRQFGGIVIPAANADDANDDAQRAGIGRPFSIELENQAGQVRYYGCVMPMDLATKKILTKLAAKYEGEWMKDPEDDGRPAQGKKRVKRFKKKVAKKKKLKVKKGKKKGKKVKKKG